MSGVAGVLFRGRPTDERAVERMLTAAPHRGSHATAVSFGAAAIGISHGAAVADASLALDGTVAAVVCGVLDDRQALRRAVARLGHPPVDDSDAALLAAAFRVYGERLPERLRGVFAGAVTDGRNLWCFRDQMGLRSLFYRDEPTGFFVASEAKQVLAGAGLPVRADREVVERIFYGDYGDETPAALQGVRRLEKATLLTAGPAGTRRSRYWDPSRYLETARLSADELQDGFDAVLDQAARRSLTGSDDVISLSGGIDSPTVAAYAVPAYRELTGRPLPALSIVAPDQPSVDESEYIKLLVDRFELPWHTYEQRVLTGGDLDRWVELCDGPVPTVTLNEIEEYFRTASDFGFRNIITGELAEFLVDRPDGLLVHLLVNGRFGALAKRLRSQRASGRPVGRILRELGSAAAPRSLAVRGQRRQDRMGWARPSWLDEDRVAAGWARHASASRHRWRNRQLEVGGPGLTMEAVEIIEMLCGVRVRRPWVDVDVWQFFLSIPGEVKYDGPLPKSLVRRLARGRVPDEILDRRRKTIFDESIRARLNYDELKRWLLQPNESLPGVDYRALATRVDNRELDLVEYRWARDLAAAHAFLELHGRS